MDEWVEGINPGNQNRSGTGQFTKPDYEPPAAGYRRTAQNKPNQHHRRRGSDVFGDGVHMAFLDRAGPLLWKCAFANGSLFFWQAAMMTAVFILWPAARDRSGFPSGRSDLSGFQASRYGLPPPGGCG